MIGVLSCTNGRRQTESIVAHAGNGEFVEVIYFHGKQRCVTCNAIERLTNEVLEENFAQQLKDHQVVFTTIDLSTREGEKIADQYEVTWSSLFINKNTPTGVAKNNLTSVGFSYAKNSPEVFKDSIRQTIHSLLQ